VTHLCLFQLLTFKINSSICNIKPWCCHCECIKVCQFPSHKRLQYEVILHVGQHYSTYLCFTKLSYCQWLHLFSRPHFTFLVDVLTSCLVTCALDHFGMDSYDGQPKKNKPLPVTLLTPEATNKWMADQARAILSR
jgi:hypothetical protein